MLRLINQILKKCFPTSIYKFVKVKSLSILEKISLRKIFVKLSFVAYKILPATFYIKIQNWAKNKVKIYESIMFLNKGAASNNTQFNLESEMNVLIRYVPILDTSVSLVICCAFTGRYEVLSEAINESFNSKYSEGIRWVLCGSTEEDMLYIKHMAKTTRKVSGLIFKNNPLGRKWQTCVTHAGDMYDAPLFAITGSDDILSSKLIDYIISRNQQMQEVRDDSLNFKNVPAMYCTTEWLIVCRQQKASITPSIIKCKLNSKSYFIPLGAGRFYTREFLQLVNFKIFDETLERCLDDYGYLKIKNLGFSIDFYAPNDGILVSVKGDWKQMNSVDAIIDSSILCNEFTFLGYQLTQANFSHSTFQYLFKNNKYTQQFLWACEF